jgi:hypothetical protein
MRESWVVAASWVLLVVQELRLRRAGRSRRGSQAEDNNTKSRGEEWEESRVPDRRDAFEGNLTGIDGH